MPHLQLSMYRIFKETKLNLLKTHWHISVHYNDHCLFLPKCINLQKPCKPIRVGHRLHRKCCVCLSCLLTCRPSYVQMYIYVCVCVFFSLTCIYVALGLRYYFLFFMYFILFLVYWLEFWAVAMVIFFNAGTGLTSFAACCSISGAENFLVTHFLVFLRPFSKYFKGFFPLFWALVLYFCGFSAINCFAVPLLDTFGLWSVIDWRGIRAPFV